MQFDKMSEMHAVAVDNIPNSEPLPHTGKQSVHICKKEGPRFTSEGFIHAQILSGGSGEVEPSYPARYEA